MTETAAPSPRSRFRRALSLIGGALLGAMIGLGIVYAAWPGWFLDAEFTRQRMLARLTEHRVQFDDQSWVYVERAGTGRTIVFVHGLAGSKENWYPTIRYLPPGDRILIPDLAGFGDSADSPDGDYRIATQVARLNAFVDALDIREFHLAGHSMGGHIAGLYAATHPDRVQSLSLLNAAGVPFPRNALQAELESGGNPFAVTDLAGFDRFAAMAFATPPYAPPRVRAAYAARIAPRAPLWRQALDQLVAEDQRYLLQQHLGDIKAPTLVLWCDRDQLLDVRSIDAFRAGLPGATIEVLNGCGHMTPMEAPEQTAALLSAQFAKARP